MRVLNAARKQPTLWFCPMTIAKEVLPWTKKELPNCSNSTMTRISKL